MVFSCLYHAILSMFESFILWILVVLIIPFGSGSRRPGGKYCRGNVDRFQV